MAIVTISRGSYSGGKEVAEKVARKLGIECISRRVLVEASEKYHVPELKLLRAFRDAPSILDRFTFGKERYIALIQAVLLARFQKDNVVYHGLAGHYFVRGVSHVLKVRITNKKDDRAELVMRREEVFRQAASAMEGLPGHSTTLPATHRGLSKERALHVLEDIDEARQKWGFHLYGIDTHDPILYDLMIKTKKLSTDDAADIICHTAQLDRFRATAESQQMMDDLLLAARVKARLVERYPRAEVTAKEGVVYVGLEGASSHEENEIRDAVGKLSGVNKVDVRSYPFVTPD